MLDKNGVDIVPKNKYEGNITDIKDEQTAKGVWTRFVTTKEQDAWGDTITRRYIDGVITDVSRTIGKSWTDPLSHP